MAVTVAVPDAWHLLSVMATVPMDKGVGAGHWAIDVCVYRIKKHTEIPQSPLRETLRKKKQTARQDISRGIAIILVFLTVSLMCDHV